MIAGTGLACGYAGVQHLWLLDPAARRLEVFARDRASWTLLEEHRGRASVSAPPFEPVAFDLAPLWGDASA